MITKRYKELRQQLNQEIMENGKLSSKVDNLNSRNVELMVECERLLNENSYLKQRNKDLRQKTWFNVYEENLKLQEELKVAKAVIESVETFVGRFTNEK